ncbi:LysM peptidoglycan-binding domain-containing protein [Isoptericola sp. NPDC057391]|uniref:LysM peptidoglycan-binding domain-containing protein n=1 Tax=Isoptericola sp. NPDC057391 TaxID=3346117 RepID=UPI00362841BE
MQNARSTSDAPGFLGLGGLRLTRRGRVVVAALVLLVLVGAGLVGQRAVAESPGAGVEVRLQTVAPGDTLWQYAQQVRDTGEDLRDVVADLRDLNGLTSAELQTGQVVVLPLD